MRVGVLTGGGDCPGVNAVVRAVVKTAINLYGWEVVGIEDGFDGLIYPERSRLLTLHDVRGILPRGGTILGTTNRGNPFAYRPSHDPDQAPVDLSDQVVDNVRRLGIDALVVIGGDCHRLHEEIIMAGGLIREGRFARFGTLPTTWGTLLSNTAGTANQNIVVATPRAGRWYILLFGWNPFWNVELKAESQ